MPHLRCHRALLRAVIVLASVVLSGCGVYLHDAQLAKSTSELKTSYENLQAPAMLAELKASEIQFAAEEDRAVVEYGVAARNAFMTGFIRHPSAAERGAPGDRASGNADEPEYSGLPGFQRHVREELATVYGPVESDGQRLNQLVNASGLTLAIGRERAQVAAEHQQAVEGLVAERNRWHAAQRARAPEGTTVARDERPTDCARVPAAPVPGPDTPADFATPSQENVDYAYYSLQLDCDATRRLDMIDDRSAIGSLINGATANSELGRVREELRQSRERQEKAATERTRLAAAIKALEDGADTGSSLESLNEEIAELQGLLETAQPRVKLIGLERLSTFIEELLAAELTAEEGETAPAATTTRAAVALQALRAIAQADDAFASQPRIDRTNSLLLGAARIRHDLRMAQLDVAREQAETQILEAQASALMAKAGHYARAQRIINTGLLDGSADFTAARQNARQRRAAGEAMAAFIGAWNQGEIPYRVLQLKAVQVRRSTALERATLTEADYRTTLKPVFDQLAAYGAGGISPETIVELLGQLGIAGAILAE